MNKQRMVYMPALSLTFYLMSMYFSSCKSVTVKNESTSDEVNLSTGSVSDDIVVEAVKVRSGAVIIDGRYIEPPYMIEGRKSGIWINGILAEKRTPRKERYQKNRRMMIQQAMEREVLSDYFILTEEAGGQDAKEKVKDVILQKGNIMGVKIRDARWRSAEEIEIDTESKEKFVINVSTDNEKYFLRKAVEKKYYTWYKSTGNKEIEAYKELIYFLDRHKQKGLIDDYKFKKGHEFEKDMLLIKYAGDLVWDGIGASFASLLPEDITTIKYPIDEEADQLDKDDLKNGIKTYTESLSLDSLEVFRIGSHAYTGSGGASIILELKKIMSDESLTSGERKIRIKKIYFPAEIEEKFLQEVLDNFGR